MDWVRDHLDRSDGFPRANWGVIGRRIAAEFSEADQDAAWDAAGHVWLREIAQSLGGDFRVEESPRVRVVTGLSRRHAAALVTFLDESILRIRHDLLPGIVEECSQKHAVVVFGDVETYTSYVAYFYPEEGEFAASAGMQLSARPGDAAWYSHCVTFGTDVLPIQAALVHELAHDVLTTLPIPGWLNEGIACAVERALLGQDPLVVTKEDLGLLGECWSDGAIQAFWSGDAIHRPDDGSRLAYMLAELCVHSLSRDFAKFREFVRTADASDAGDAAARAVYGGGLGPLIARFLGPGEWSPEPASWSSAPDSAP
jgi:hypothetical protein